MAQARYSQSFAVVEKRELCPGTWFVRVEAPLVARKVEAGQFVIVRPLSRSERMPLSIAGWDRDRGTLDLVIAAVGCTSSEAVELPVGGRFCDIVGPLGERSHVERHEGACIVVGGGYGSGAVIPTARAHKALGNRVYGIIGARSADLLIMAEELGSVCDRLVVTTNDGSAGVEGFVTEALAPILAEEAIASCLAVGPVPMMRAVAGLTLEHGVECFVSLNAIMLDGTGMCGACRVTVGGETHFACVDGPDFDGHAVDFEELMTRQRMFAAQEQRAMACRCAGENHG